MKGMFLDDSMSNLTSASNEASLSSSSNKNDVGTMYPPTQSNNIQTQTNKKKRNLPGNPDPEAEVIAMSPKTLMATNRFVCEVCNKGFQRDQNLQLHRRGHNLPWKLKQRSKTEVVRKKVYVCPEPSCVHHEPARALGDLTGIKKHFSRKHGEKKWKCEKCTKRYAVQSDWKAHSKICGTREYRCDCGTLFSRRDSFMTHRAFCGALAGDVNHGRSSPSLVHHPLDHLPITFPLKTEPIFSSNIMTSSNILQQNNTPNQLPSWFIHHHQQDPNNDNVSNMSATALLQKAAQIGVTMSKATANVMSQQQLQYQSILSGPQKHDHMRAPTTLLTTAHHHHGHEDLSSCVDDNQQGMLELSGGQFSNVTADHCFDQICATSNYPMHDFLGVKGFPPPNSDHHFLDMAGLNRMSNSPAYHHQHDPNQNQNQNELPWQG